MDHNRFKQRTSRQLRFQSERRKASHGRAGGIVAEFGDPTQIQYQQRRFLGAAEREGREDGGGEGGFPKPSIKNNQPEKPLKKDPENKTNSTKTKKLKKISVMPDNSAATLTDPCYDIADLANFEKKGTKKLPIEWLNRFSKIMDHENQDLILHQKIKQYVLVKSCDQNGTQRETVIRK